MWNIVMAQKINRFIKTGFEGDLFVDHIVAHIAVKGDLWL